MTRLLVSLALVALPAAAQTIYSWEDKNGTHYTDDPSLVPNNARMDATLLKAKQKAQPQDDQQIVISDSTTPTQPKQVVTQPVVSQPQPPLVAQPTRPDDIERQWRDRFIEVNRRIETLEKNYRALEKTRPQQVQCSGSTYTPAPSSVNQIDPQTGAPIIPAGTTFYSNNSPASVTGVANAGTTTMINGRPYVAVPNCASNPEFERITREMELMQVQLSDARKDLDQLDRIASQNAIPREWRRGW